MLEQPAGKNTGEIGHFNRIDYQKFV